MKKYFYGLLGARKKFSFNKIVVIGDSHVRTFSVNENFSPFFVGPGKEFNFLEKKTSNRIRKAIERIVEATTDRYFLLVFGEPDTRFLLGKGWHPWQVDDSTENERYNPQGVQVSSKNYLELLDLLSQKYVSRHFFVLNVTPSRRELQNQIVRSFNEKLEKGINEKRRSNVFFVGVNQFVMSEENLVRDEFMEEKDPVHLNQNIQPLVEQYFLEHGVLEGPILSRPKVQSNSELQQMFKFDRRFGCYVVNR